MKQYKLHYWKKICKVMPTDLNRTLVSVLISKLGGNVDHKMISILLELIDNALDAHASNISIKLVKGKNTFLDILDNGTGIKDINNIFLANIGKKGQIGCKNQGFLDSLVYLSKLTGNLDILTCHDKIITGMRVKFNEMNNEYERQKKLEVEGIDYRLLQDKLSYNIFDSDDTLKLLDPSEETKSFIKNGGTFIRIPIHPSFDLSEIEDIKINYFQYHYSKVFTLNYLENTIELTNEISVLEPTLHKPLTIECETYKHANNEIKYRLSNNYSEDKIYYKKTSKSGKVCKIDKDLFKSDLNNYKSGKLFKIDVSLISSNVVQKQTEIFRLQKEELRGVFIFYKNKTLGPFKYPGRGISNRNLLDIRLVLTIFDEDVLNEIIMTNKSHTNLDRLDNVIKYYFKNSIIFKKLNYDSPIGKVFSNDKKYSFLNENAHCVDLAEYINCPEEYIQKNIVPQMTIENKKRYMMFLNPEEPINYYYWKCAAYIGIFDCNTDKGISIKDSSINVHYGITNQDPNKRDSGGDLGIKNGWRRIHYAQLNNEGSKKDKEKRKVEYAIYEELKKIEATHSITFKTKEHFSVKLNKFKEVLDIMRVTISKYEEWF